MSWLKSVAKSILPGPVVGLYRRYKISSAVESFAAYETRHRYGGRELRVAIGDPLAQGWYDHDWPLIPEIKHLKARRLKPGALVFDLGAHQAVVAMMLAEQVHPGGKVVAVEASPHNAAAAKRNVALNPGLSVEILNAAIAAKPGELDFGVGFNGSVDDGTGAWGRVRVPAVTIDDLHECFGPPAVVFVDIEGFELEALKGAAKTLARAPDWFIEVHLDGGLQKFGGGLDALLAYFDPTVYDLWMNAEGS
ncbi:MAG TPA: FkbM family methyltransferase, partial [Bdellovibrionales bacterium]|nr:FkbM family methyltransferase [Bdellovibrionales bacterium]